MIYLVEIEYYNTQTNIVETLYTASQGIPPFAPNDPDRPNHYYHPIVKQPGNVEYYAFAKGTTAGSSRTGTGEVILLNADGTLDYLADHAFDGRAIRIYSIVDTDQNSAFADYSLLLSGTIEQITFNFTENRASTIGLRIRNKQVELDIPIQENRYLGNNSGISGIEGNPDNIKDTVKPLLYGQVLNVTPILVNHASLIYQLHDGALANITQVYDNGAALTKGNNHASLASLQSATINGGSFETCLSLGLFKLGSSPTGLITADAEQNEKKVASIIQDLVEAKTNITVDSDSINSINSNSPYMVGIYIDQERSLASVMDELSESIGISSVFDPTGRLLLKQLSEPGNQADYALTQQDILKIRKLPTGDDDRSIPAWRVNLQYQKNYTTQQNNELAGSVQSNGSRVAFLSKPYRSTSQSDTSINSKHLLSPELSRTTLLIDEVDAVNEATRLLNLYKVKRDRYQVTITANSQLQLMDIVHITLDRMNLNTGKHFLIIGIKHVFSHNQTIIDCWG